MTNLSPSFTNVGRIAFRTENHFWVAYFATPISMEGAVRLASVHLRFLHSPQRQTEFIDFVRLLVTDLMEDLAAPLSLHFEITPPFPLPKGPSE